MVNTEKAAGNRRRKKAAGGKFHKAVFAFGATFLLLCAVSLKTRAASINIGFDTASGDAGLSSLQLLMLFALLSLLPSLLIMMTSFTRIVIVFSFLRNALGLQQTPPNQVLTGLALFLSLFIMSPVLKEVNEKSVQPYIAGQITQKAALQQAEKPLKQFMLKQTKSSDLNLFLSLSKQKETADGKSPQALLKLDLSVIVPAFITSELKRAFTMGFLIFLPFMIIDMIVASTLMSMGMVMLPPSMISLPFKIMLFVMVDGWSLLMEMLITSFY